MNVKFFKGNYGATDALNLSTQNVGGIVFDNTSHQIFVGGVAYGGNITDVTFGSSVLTITKATGDPITLDFSDTASASATFEVFQQMNQILGVSTNTTSAYLDYTSTNYLTTSTNLVDADKALDAQIKAVNDTIGSMNATNVQGVTATDTGDVIELTLKGVSETDGVITQGSGTDKVTFAKVAKTGKAIDVAVDDTLSVFTGTNVEDVLLELSSKITDSNLTINGQVGAFTTDNTMISVDSTHKVLGVKTTGYIGTSENGIDLVASKVDTAGTSTEGTDLATVETVKTYIGTEIAALDVDPLVLATIATDQITIANVEEVNGKIGVNGTTEINVDGTVSSSNPLVTKSSITTAIGSLDVDGYAQGTVTGSAITIYGIKEEDGKIGSDTMKNLTIALDGTYDASTNQVALKSTVTDAINTLNTTSDVVPVTADNTNGVIKITMKGIAEEDGVIKEGTTISSISFAKVASTGKAEDITFTTGDYVGSNLEQAVNDMDNRIESLEALPTYDVVVVGTEALPTASADTMHKIYLKTEDLTSTKNTYGEYITVRSGSDPNYTYSWEKLGTTAASLEGYIKTVVVNGKSYTVDSGTGTTVTLHDAITSITDGDGNITTDTAYTDAYIDTEVTVVSTKDTTNGTYEAQVTSAAKVKIQAVADADSTHMGLAEASDVKDYVDTTIEGLDKVSTDVTGTNVKITYKEENGIVTIATVTETYATVGNDLSVSTNTGLVTGADIEKVKTYIGTRVQDLNVDETPVTGTNVSFKYKETNGVVEIGTLVVDYAGVTVDTTAGQAPTMTVTDGTKLAVGSDVEKGKEYTDAKVAYEISQLGTTVTSDDAAVATVQVVEANGKITEVNVTNVSAGVTGNDTTLSATTDTGAVTGADIAKIKAYIDGQIGTAAAVTDIISTITVNDTNRTNIATIGTTNITAAVALVWDVYEDPQP